MFGLDASKKKKLSKVAKDKQAAAASAKSAGSTALQRSASTRVPSGRTSGYATGASNWDASVRPRTKVFEWIDEEGRSVSPPPPFARDQVREVSKVSTCLVAPSVLSSRSLKSEAGEQVDPFPYR